MKKASFRFHVLLLGAIVVMVSLGVSFVIDPAPHGPKFATELAFLLLSEILATLAFGVVLEKDDATRPLGTAFVPISVGYVMFALMMAAVGAFADLSTAAFLSIHLVGLAVVVALAVFVDMGERQVRAQDNRDRTVLAPKRTFLEEARLALEEAKTRFSGREDLLSLAEKSVDDLRYAATSRAGSEAVDDGLAAAIAELSRSVSEGDEKAFETALREVDRRHRIRQMKIKSL